MYFTDGFDGVEMIHTRIDIDLIEHHNSRFLCTKV